MALVMVGTKVLLKLHRCSTKEAGERKDTQVYISNITRASTTKSAPAHNGEGVDSHREVAYDIWLVGFTSCGPCGRGSCGRAQRAVDKYISVR